MIKVYIFKVYFFKPSKHYIHTHTHFIKRKIIFVNEIFVLKTTVTFEFIFLQPRAKDK